MDFSEELNVESAELPVESSVVGNSSEPVIQSQIQETMKVDTNFASGSTQPSSILEWKIVPTTESNTLFNSNFAPEYAVKAYNDIWKKNFDYVLGPCNSAFIDAILSYKDIADGLHLEYNPNGILWRVNAAGIPTYEDLNKYFEQNRVIESANESTLKEIDPQVSSDSKSANVSGTVENSPLRPIPGMVQHTPPADGMGNYSINASGLLAANGILPGQGKLIKLSTAGSEDFSERDMLVMALGGPSAVNLSDDAVIDLFVKAAKDVAFKETIPGSINVLQKISDFTSKIADLPGINKTGLAKMASTADLFIQFPAEIIKNASKNYDVEGYTIDMAVADAFKAKGIESVRDLTVDKAVDIIAEKYHLGDTAKYLFKAVIKKTADVAGIKNYDSN
jgi:hypothetical protein